MLDQKEHHDEDGSVYWRSRLCADLQDDGYVTLYFQDWGEETGYQWRTESATDGMSVSISALEGLLAFVRKGTTNLESRSS